MRKLIAGIGLLAGGLSLVAQSPSMPVRAQEKAAPVKPKSQAQPSANAVTPPAKEASIRQLMELTGVQGLGAQMLKTGIEQFRRSVTESDNPRAKQFIDAFVAGFQKHFDPESLTEKVVPIYDKYLTEEDLQGLLQYYRSPLGQRMLKA